MAILTIQRRMMELGRVRLGEKGPKGEPRRRSSFRFTTASKPLADAVAQLYGGQVEAWKGAPAEGYYEIGTDACELEIVLPPIFSAADGMPTLPYSQFFELWSGGGCQRRCDGQTEALSGKPCMCDAQAPMCKPTTRVSFILPQLPGLGIWRMDTHGWNAAAELPGALELLAHAAYERRFISAILRIEQRSTKVEGKTNRFLVPVIDLPGLRVSELIANAPASVNGPAPRPPRPELPSGPALPADARFAEPDEAEWGETPSLPSLAATHESTVRGERATSRESTERTERPDPLALESQLLGIAEQLGTTERVATAIDKHKQNVMHNVALHVAWLERQIERATARAAG